MDASNTLRPSHTHVIYYAPPLIGGALSDAFVWRMSDVWRLSVAYIRPKSRTERPRKTKIGTEVAHVTRDSDTTFKVKRPKVKVTRPLYSPLFWRVRQLQRWAWERVGREKMLLRCRLLGRARRLCCQRIMFLLATTTSAYSAFAGPGVSSDTCTRVCYITCRLL